MNKITKSNIPNIHFISSLFLRSLTSSFTSKKPSQDSTTQQSPVHIYNKKIEEIQKIQDWQMRQKQYQSANRQLHQKLAQEQQNQKLSKVRNYLIEGVKNQQSRQEAARKSGGQQENQNEKQGFIPPGLVLKKLKFMNKRILMMGIQQENEDHCIYIKRMCQKLETKVVLTALPPDMPYFIKTELSFGEEWKKFLQNPVHAKNSKFYLNPSPYNISQFCLDSNQIPLVRQSLAKSKQFYQIFYAILQHNRLRNRFLPNGLLTPLLVNNVQKLYFCDFPVLKQRQMWAMLVPTVQMRQLFKIYHRQINSNKQLMFDPRILFPKPVITRKFEHMANAVKYGSYQSQKPTVFICPSQYTQMFITQFKKDKPISSSSDFSYKLFTNSNINSNNNRQPVMFIDFVEKLVIMDFILEPVIHKYFVKNISFPYTALETVGGRENIGKIFMVWNHFYNLYKEQLEKQPTL